MRRTRKIQAMSGLSYRGRTGTARAVRHFPRLLAAVALALAAGAAHAWNNHALLTWVAAGAIPALAGAPAVRVEPLERFLSAREAEVAALLEREEAWAVGALPAYAPRPAALAFRTGGDPVTRRTRFLRALRVNPDVRLAAVVQLRPRDAAGTRALARWQDVTTLSNPGTLVHARFARLEVAQDVLAALEFRARFRERGRHRSTSRNVARNASRSCARRRAASSRTGWSCDQKNTAP